MWKGILIAGCCFWLALSWPSAQPLSQLSTDALLNEAAAAIQTLKQLNEDLQAKAIASARKSETLAQQLTALQHEREMLLKDIEALQTRLATLQTDWEHSEKTREELVRALQDLKQCLQNSEREAKRKQLKLFLEGMAVGVGMAVAMNAILTLR
jgi:flagellar motility protein MotE (MotC chaperone)